MSSDRNQEVNMGAPHTPSQQRNRTYDKNKRLHHQSGALPNQPSNPPVAIHRDQI